MRVNPNSLFSVAVCDTELLDRQNTVGHAGDLLLAEGMVCEISQYVSGTELFAAIKSGARFQHLLLDVIMDNLDGMELAAALRGLGNDMSIIFIFSNRDMAMRGVRGKSHSAGAVQQGRRNFPKVFPASRTVAGPAVCAVLQVLFCEPGLCVLSV